MSFAGNSLAAIFDQVVSFTPQRSIGGITATATVQEDGTDEIETTDHPVQQNAPITDHAYLKPAVVTIHIGFSQSLVGVLSGSGSLSDIYQSLLTMLQTRALITVVTGKRSYSNMLLMSVRQTTDEETENVLMITVVCKQIFVVNTQTVAVPSSSVQTNPAANGAVQTQGSQQVQPAANYNPG